MIEIDAKSAISDFVYPAKMYFRYRQLLLWSSHNQISRCCANIENNKYQKRVKLPRFYMLFPFRPSRVTSRLPRGSPRFSYPFISHPPFYFLYRSRWPRKIPGVLRPPFLSSSKHTAREIERDTLVAFYFIRSAAIRKRVGKQVISAIMHGIF